MAALLIEQRVQDLLAVPSKPLPRASFAALRSSIKIKSAFSDKANAMARPFADAQRQQGRIVKIVNGHDLNPSWKASRPILSDRWSRRVVEFLLHGFRGRTAGLYRRRRHASEAEALKTSSLSLGVFGRVLNPHIMRL